MTNTREELMQSLGDLQALTRKKNQLAKPERDEAVRLLSALCVMDAPGFDATMQALHDFPSDTGAEVLAGCWENLGSPPDLVYRALNDSSFATDRGKRLRLVLGHRLSTRDPNAALRILLDVCQGMKPAVKPLPTVKDLGLINSALLERGVETLSNLPLNASGESQVSQFIVYLLSAGFAMGGKGKHPSSPQTQLALIRWASGYGKLSGLPHELARDMTARVREWNDDYKALLRSDSDRLHPAFKAILGPLGQARVPELALQTPLVGTTQGSGAGGGFPATDPTSSAPDGQPPPVDYNSAFEISRLGNYVKQVETLLRKKQEGDGVAERDRRQAEAERRAAIHELEEARRQVARTTAHTGELTDRKMALEKENESLRKTISGLEGKLGMAESRLAEAVETHTKHADELSERIAHEGTHRLLTYKNRLAGVLRGYVATLSEAQGMDVTPDVGKALLTQMKQLLRALKMEGIPIEGDESWRKSSE